MPAPVKAWLQAARPPAQANIAVPLLFGQALAYAQAGAFSWKRFALVHVYGLFVHLFIVFANDAADWRADLGNKTYNVFSGGSRVVPEGKLTPRQLANGAMLMALGIGAIGAVAGFIERLPFAVVLAALPLGILWAYSFPPFRLSYRGNGEVLQALGVGVVLPLTAFYYQAGTFAPLHLASIVPTALLGYAGNVTTALPDTPADRKARKRTLAVVLGERPARITAIGVTAAALLLGFMALPGKAPWIAAVAALAPAVALGLAVPLVPHANASARSACLRFVVLVAGAGSLAQLGWTAAAFIAP